MSEETVRRVRRRSRAVVEIAKFRILLSGSPTEPATDERKDV